MKKYSLLIFCVLCQYLTILAQTPYYFNYQAVALNASGTALTNTNISLKISILDSIATGPVQYAETHSATTNGFGLFTLRVGSGTILSGTMQQVNWKKNDKFIKVEFDPAGGSNYIHMGTTQLLSVPYALHAKNGNWEAIGNDIQKSNAGNVVIAENMANTNAKLVVKSVGESQAALSIIDTNTTGYPALKINNQTNMAFGTAIQVNSTGQGASISSKNEGLMVYSDSSIAAYLQSENMNGPTVRIHNNTNTPASKAMWVTGGNVNIGNTSNTLPGKLAVKVHNESQYAVNIVDTNSFGYPAIRTLYNSTSGATAMELLSNQKGISLSTSKRALEVNGDLEEAAVFSSNTSGYPTVRITNSTGAKALHVEGKSGFGNALPLEMVDIAGALKISNNGNNSINPPNGGEGTIRYNTANHQFEGFNGITWTIFDNDSILPLTYVAHNSTLSGSGTISDPLKIANGSAINDVLKWNGTTWVSGSASSGFSVPYSSGNLSNSSTLFTLQNSVADALNIGGKSSFNRFSNSPLTATTTVDINGELRLRDQQNQFTPTALPGVIRFENGVFSGYNGSAWLNFGTATGDNWGTQVVQRNATLTGNGTTGSPLGLAQNGASNGQVLQWNGSAWVPASVGGGSSVWSQTGNDISNTNSGKILMGTGGLVYGNGEVQIKTNAPMMGTGAKLWSDNSYANTVYIADSALSGGPISCTGCMGNNPLKVYTPFGTSIFATTTSGDAAYLVSTTGQALMVNGKVKDDGSKFAINTGNMTTSNNTYTIPSSFSNQNSDIIVMTPVGGSTTTNRTYMLSFNTTLSQWQIKTKDASNFESNLSFNLMRVGK